MAVLIGCLIVAAALAGVGVHAARRGESHRRVRRTAGEISNQAEQEATRRMYVMRDARAEARRRWRL